eukprot:3286846-Alexandrium_andersonii.AAC.1
MQTPASTHVPALTLAFTDWWWSWSWGTCLGFVLLLLQSSAMVWRAAFVAAHVPSAIVPAHRAG